MKPQISLMVFALLAPSAAGPFLHAQTDSRPIVVGIKGKWKIGTDCSDKGDDYLKFAQLFPANEKACEADTGGSLVILVDEEATSYHCANTRDHPQCELQKDHHCVCTPRTGKTSLFQAVGQSLSAGARSLSAAISPLFTESLARYVTPVARGLEPDLADSVVQLQGDRVDLPPVFQEMDAGTYRLRLESLAGSAWTSGPVQLQWSGGGPASVPIPGLKPGLYRLVRLTPNGQPAGQDAWLLVSPPDRFARDSAAFQSAAEATKKWPDDVDARAPRAALRAYLESLSLQAQTGR